MLFPIKIIMKQSIYRIAVIALSLLFALSIPLPRVLAQVVNQSSRYAPGGVAGYARWGLGCDTSPILLNSGKGMTFVGVGKVRQGSEQLLWNVSRSHGRPHSWHFYELYRRRHIALITAVLLCYIGCEWHSRNARYWWYNQR